MKLERIFSNADDAHLECDSEGIIQRASPDIEKHLRLRSEQVVRTSLSDYFSSEIEYLVFRKRLADQGFLSEVKAKFLVPS